MLPILQVGPFAVQFPGLLLLAGVWVGTYLIDREAPRHGLSAAVVNNLVFTSLVAGLVGARLAYALRYLDVYVENPLSLFSLNPSTLALWEGVGTGLVAALVYGQRRRLPFWPTLDALTPSLALFAVFLGLANLASGDAFGAPSELPWAIELWGERRHPTQVYETLAAVLILVAVLRLRRDSPFAGFIFLVWVGLTALARLALEAFRGDSLLVLGGLRQAQLVSLAVLLASLVALHLRARRSLKRDERG